MRLRFFFKKLTCLSFMSQEPQPGLPRWSYILWIGKFIRWFLCSLLFFRKSKSILKAGFVSVFCFLYQIAKLPFNTLKHIFISWNWHHHKWYFVTNRKKLASWIQNDLQTLSVQHVSCWHFEERKQEQSKPKGIWNIFCIFQVSGYWSSL